MLSFFNAVHPVVFFVPCGQFLPSLIKASVLTSAETTLGGVKLNTNSNHTYSVIVG